jgi:hypothetical protein
MACLYTSTPGMVADDLVIEREHDLHGLKERDLYSGNQAWCSEV